MKQNDKDYVKKTIRAEITKLLWNRVQQYRQQREKVAAYVERDPTVALRDGSVHFRSFWTTADVARVMAGATRWACRRLSGQADRPSRRARSARARSDPKECLDRLIVVG